MSATSGPWVVRPAVCRNDHPDTSADVHGPQGQFVADCGCHENATANAQLIASAPEQQAKIDALADALERLLAEAEMVGLTYAPGVRKGQEVLRLVGRKP